MPEFDDGAAAGVAAVPAVGAGAGGAGLEEVAVLVAEDPVPAAGGVGAGEFAGVGGGDGPEADELAGVLVEAEQGGQAQGQVEADRGAEGGG